MIKSCITRERYTAYLILWWRVYYFLFIGRFNESTYTSSSVKHHASWTNVTEHIHSPIVYIKNIVNRDWRPLRASIKMITKYNYNMLHWCFAMSEWKINWCAEIICEEDYWYISYETLFSFLWCLSAIRPHVIKYMDMLLTTLITWELTPFFVVRTPFLRFGYYRVKLELSYIHGLSDMIYMAITFAYNQHSLHQFCSQPFTFKNHWTEVFCLSTNRFNFNWQGEFRSK